MKKLFFIILILCSLQACQTVQIDDGNKQIEQEPSAISEGLSYTVYEGSRFVQKYVGRPVGFLWSSLLPIWGQDRIYYAFTNLEFPAKLVSAMARNGWEDAGVETSRFLINSTVGLLGMFDVANNQFGIEPRSHGFGQTFNEWGIAEGPQIQLTSVGVSNTRDVGGKVVDFVLDPKTYIPIPGLGVAGTVNEFSRSYRNYDMLDYMCYDSYEIARRYFIYDMAVKMDPYNRYNRLFQMLKQCDFNEERFNKLKSFKDLSPYQMMRDVALEYGIKNESVWADLSVWKNSFYERGTKRECPILANRPNLIYLCYMQPEPTDKVCVVLQGAGTFFLSEELAHIAEKFYKQKYNIIIIPSAFNFNFYRAACTSALPGNFKTDNTDLLFAISKVLKQEERRDKTKFTQKVLLGFSLSASQALAIAATETSGRELKFDQYIALSPLVKLEMLNQRLKEGAKFLSRLKTSEKIAIITVIIEKMRLSKPYYESYLNLSLAYDKAFGEPSNLDSHRMIKSSVLPLSESEEKILQAYNFSFVFQDLLVCAIREKKLKIPAYPPEKGHRFLYDKMASVDFDCYMKKILPYAFKTGSNNLKEFDFLQPYHLQLFQQRLLANPKVYVFHANEDFMNTKEDINFLKTTFKKRIKSYDSKTHMGYFYHPKFGQDLDVLIEKISRSKNVKN